MSEQTASAPSDLGQVLREFRPNRGLFIFLIVIGILLFACGAFTAISEFLRPNTQIAGVIVGVILFILGAAASWFAYRRLTTNIRRYIAYENGLVELRGGKRKVIRWDEIILIWRDVTQVRQVGEPMSESSRYYSWRLRRRDGQDWRVIGQHELGRLIEERVYPLIWNELMDGIEAGKAARFGDIMLSRSGIGYGDEQIPWEDVQNISLAGHVQIKTQSGERNFRWARTADLPNLPLLKKAIREIGGQEIG